MMAKRLGIIEGQRLIRWVIARQVVRKGGECRLVCEGRAHLWAAVLGVANLWLPM